MMSKTLHDKTPMVEVLAYKKASKDYRKLCQLAKPTMKKGDDLKLKSAFRLALACYKEKQHEAKNAYTWQPIEIARIVAESIGLGVIPIICTLLHGLSADIAPSEIRKIFGAKVAQTLHVLMQLEFTSQLKEVSRTKISAALTIALKQNPKVVLIKLAENLQNMRTLAHASHEQQAEIASQAKCIYVPIAHRLGLSTIKAELEDLHLKYTNAKVYHAIAEQIQSSGDARERFIRRFKKPIQELLQREKFSFAIKARTKSITSIWNKMKAMGLSFERVYDVFAIRIILNVPQYRENLDCWKAYEVVTSIYKVHPTKFRNFLSYPRKNGYQSLHATVMDHEGVWVEVQIRTKRMDAIAEQGNAAHWKYKKDGNMEYVLGPDIWLRQISILLEQKSRAPDKVIDAIDAGLPINKIEVFTHKNKPRSLPTGATVLDLAFELGTSCGLRCTGGQVNNKQTAYHYILNHGDQVKVVTANQQQVAEDWLDFTVTYKAHNVIKKFLQQQQDKTIASGKKIVQKWLKEFYLEWNAEIIEQLLGLFEEEKVEDFYYKLGEGSIALRQLKNFPSALYKTQKHRLSHQGLKPLMRRFNEQEQW